MDDECLISMVRDKECLYNYSSSLYKNTILKANCWEEIAQALLPVPERISLQEAGIVPYSILLTKTTILGDITSTSTIHTVQKDYGEIKKKNTITLFV